MSQSLESLHASTVLITGAGMGMGRMYAQLAVADKARHVILWDIDAAALEESAALLRGQGSEIHTQVVDVSKLEAIEAAAQEVRNGPGAPDILINNAGIVRG